MLRVSASAPLRAYSCPRFVSVPGFVTVPLSSSVCKIRVRSLCLSAAESVRQCVGMSALSLFLSFPLARSLSTYIYYMLPFPSPRDCLAANVRP